MVVTFSDDEVSDDESGCDEDGNFIAFIAIAVVNESMFSKENPSNRELFEDANLQETYNKLCKVATKDATNVELYLKKIASLELEKKILLVKLFDANDLLNNVKTENMLLFDANDLLIGNSLRMQIYKKLTTNFAKLLQRML